ncbi:MAG TPA: carboxypeptidase regulatory-like domain-containing protein [Candidatus Sulfotelmatobacter sp.]|nr:carboxypeptidase regulatory-like domain-containing protein [Candidatus Sulfotelmatobacter sp.]
MSRERLAILASSFIAIGLLLACLTIPAAAQLYTGSIAGTVTDPSGAVVPAAHVVATDVDKGYTFPGTTDANGHYLLRNIPPGNYTVSVEAPNFESQKKTGAVITVNLNATIDFTLKVGATSQTVEVQATGVELQTQDAVTGQVIDRRAINNLPLVGRDVLQLTFLAPGVVPVAEASHNDEGGTGLNFNSNGGRNSTADFVMDGTSISNIEQNGGTNNVLRAPPVDSIEEFKVQQTNFSAEFGFAGGTVINAITRSGTNAFHGSLHEFWRNQILDANDWFSDAQTPKVPIQPLRRNQFGGAIGGPIRKNKTFFFFDYDGLRLRQFTSNSGAVPTLCERGDPTATCPVGTPALGNFGEICTLQGGTFGTGTDPVTGNTFLNVCQSGGTLLSSGQIWDPYSGISSVGSNGHFATRQTPVAFNNLSTYMNTNAGLPLVPGNLIDPLAQKLFLLFPKPNLSASSPIFEGGTNWSFSGVTPQSDNKWDLKVDHHFNDRNLLSVRYSQENSSSNTADCYGNIADPCSASGPTSGHTYLLAVNYTKTFSPNVLMNITYGGARNFSYTQGIGANIGFSQFKNDLNSLYSLPGQSCNIAAPSAAQCFGAVGLEEGGNLFDNVPNVNISASGGTLGTYNTPGISSTFSILKQGQDTHTVADTVSWLRGKHEFKFGGEFRIARDNFVQPGAPAGQFNFSYIGTSQFSDAGNDGINGSGAPADGGDDLASMLVGVGDPTNGSPPPAGCFNGTGGCFRGFNNAVSTQNWRYAWFFNDNFHATQKLTVNLGLRYELSLPRTERFNRMEWLDPSKPAAIQYNATQLAMINTFNSTPLVPGNPATTPTALGIPSPTVLHGAEVFVGQNGASRYNYNPYYNAIQPRIGLAWQLPNNFGVLRTGYGIYYDAPRSAVSGTGPVGFDGFDIQPPWLTVDASNVPNQVPCGRLSNPNGNPVSGCNTSNLAFPTPPGNTLGAFNNLGFGANGPIPIINSKIPYEQSWSLGLQKQLPSKILLDMNYIGKKGTHLYAGGFNTLQLLGRPFEKAVLSGALTPADINTINQESVANPFASPTACSNPPNTNYICSTTSGEGSIVPTIGATQLLTPFPQFAFFGGDAFPVADSTYHALQVRAERAFANGLEFLVTYTWSKSIDNVSFQDFSNQFLGNGGGTNSLQDPFNPRGDRAVSVFDIPQLLQLSYEYELPIGRGKAFGGNWNPILNAIVGGWRTSGIWTVSDGRPLTLTGSNASIPTYGQRPNLSAPLKRSSTSYQRLINGLPNTAPTASYFSNPNALSVAPNFTFGNAPRTITSVLSPGIRNAELALFKEFQIREGIQIEFRAEATNALNHPQFIPPDTDITSGTFGQIVPGGGGFSSGSGAVTINSPRELQLGLKLYF